MSGYFIPLRRKFGIATLAIACVFVAGWMRSLVFIDEIGFVGEERYQRLCLMQGAIVWARETPTPKKQSIHDGWVGGVLQEQFRKYPTLQGWQSCYPYDLEMWQISGLGFGYGVSQPAGYKLVVWIVPYWSVVLFWTLLSASLLLSKPNQSKPTARDVAA